MVDSSSGFVLAVLAGGCASLASVSSKLALEGEGKTLRYVVPCAWMTELHCVQVLMVVRALCILLMLVFNAVMWNLFVKSMQRCGSTMQATVTNTASNFFCTAFFGKVLFGEALALLWWLGASLIIFGLVFLNYSAAEVEKKQTKQE